jgi:hypothetical protein
VSKIWFLSLREEHRLRVFGNRVLSNILGPTRDKITGEWRRLHNKELHVLCFSPNIIRVIKSRRMRWAGHVARMGERKGAHRILVEKDHGKRSLERPRLRWDDNIKMDFQNVGWGGMEWTAVAQDRDKLRALEHAVMKLGVP